MKTVRSIAGYCGILRDSTEYSSCSLVVHREYPACGSEPASNRVLRPAQENKEKNMGRTPAKKPRAERGGIGELLREPRSRTTDATYPVAGERQAHLIDQTKIRERWIANKKKGSKTIKVSTLWTDED